MREVIGLDLSLVETGVATPERVFTVKTKPTDGTLEERMRYIRQQIWAETWFDGADVVLVIEGPAYAAAGNALYQVWGLQAVIRVTATIYDIPFELVAPPTLKKFATGSGRAKKPEMITAAQANGYDGKNHNEADAFHLRRYGVAQGWGQ